MKVTFESKLDAVNEWVKEFNVIPKSLLDAMCVAASIGYPEYDVIEVTMPSLGDEVSFWYEDEEKSDTDIKEIVGLITEIDYTEECFTVEAEEEYKDEIITQAYTVPWCDIKFDATLDGIQVDDPYPSWDKMYSFDTLSDNQWIDQIENLIAMSNLGFRIYKCEEIGYVFGFDTTDEGDYYKEYWEPLYDERGLNWFNEEK